MKTWAALVISPADDLVEAALLDYGVVAVEESSASAWRVFFTSAAARDAAAAGLRRDFPSVSLDSLDVPDDNWAARSQAALKAVTVGALIIAPPWDVPAEAAGLQVRPIVINPSMGFGTGHHATTRLCLAALQRIDLRGKWVIDVGTGSGVLAIAASLLGAPEVVGIDDDADAIQAANENAALNPAARVAFQAADLREAKPELYPARDADAVLANLTGGLLIAAAHQLKELVSPGGVLILSGFMAHEEEDVLRGFDYYEVDWRAQEDEWVCVTLRRPAMFM